MADRAVPQGPTARDTDVDLLVVGSGTGMAAALTAAELGLKVLVIEKTAVVGGSTARSGGAFWIPPNHTLTSAGANDSRSAVREYIDSLVGQDAPRARWEAYVTHGAETVRMLERTTPMRFFWARGYSDYHPENPGGSSAGRSCECSPLNAEILGSERGRLRGGVLEAPVPMPVTGADYKWMNLMVRTPARSLPRIVKRVAQGVGGKVMGRDYVAGGQALAAGMFAGLLQQGVPLWTRTELLELIVEDDTVTGAILKQDDKQVTIHAKLGVILATGGFDHDMEMRQKYQSPILREDLGLGAEGNVGDGIKIGQTVGAGVDLMQESWWFPGIAPLPGEAPQILLAERSLPGSLIVDDQGKRFINEATDYMSFGQAVLKQAAQGNPAESMWLIFDQKYRASYMFAGVLFPGMPIPQSWYDAGIAVTGKSPHELADKANLPVEAFRHTLARFNKQAELGVDHDFGRGSSAYDRYYGDPTVTPNPNLRPLRPTLYAVKLALSDLGTCGGLTADERGRVLATSGKPIPGLYSIGNNAANVFGKTYPGAGATIGQGLVYGMIAAMDAANR